LDIKKHKVQIKATAEYTVPWFDVFYDVQKGAGL